MQKLEDMQSVGSSSSDHIYSGNNSRTESSSNAIRKDGRETSSFNGDNLSSSSYGSDFDSKMERTDSAVRSNYSVSRPGSSLKMMPTTSYQSSRDSDKDRSCRNDKISSSNTPTSITSYPTIGSGKGNESPKSGNKLPTATSASIAAPLFFSPSKSANNSSNSIKVNNLQSAPSMSSSSSSANKTRYIAFGCC